MYNASKNIVQNCINSYESQTSGGRFKFNTQFSLENRIDESRRICAKYPDRIPIIIEPSTTCKLNIDKTKYLVPRDLTVGQFMYVIRKRLKLPAEKAIFLFVNGTIPSSTTMVNILYENEKDTDNFLKMHYSEENTFG